MSSIGSAPTNRSYEPAITTYNQPDPQDYERSDRLRQRREPSIVKITATSLHRNLGIHSSSLPSGDFEEQIRRSFRSNTVDRSDPGPLFSCQISTVRDPIDGRVATTTSPEVNELRITSIGSTVRTTQTSVETESRLELTGDVPSFDALTRVQRNVAENHRPNPTRVIEARRQLDVQRAASSTSTTINMEKAFAKAKRREKQPPRNPFVIKPASIRSLPPLDQPLYLPSPNTICSSSRCSQVARPTLSELIGSNILGEAQKNGSPAPVPRASIRRNTSERARGSHNPYELDSLGTALPPESPPGTWNFGPIAASLPYLRPEMKVQNHTEPCGGRHTSTRKKVRFARESSGRNLGVQNLSKLEKRSYTERNRAATRASSQNPS